MINISASTPDPEQDLYSGWRAHGSAVNPPLGNQKT
jgi:hypothetical protein